MRRKISVKKERICPDGDRAFQYMLVKNRVKILCSKCSRIQTIIDEKGVANLIYLRVEHDLAEHCRCYGKPLPTDLHLEGSLPKWYKKALKERKIKK